MRRNPLFLSVIIPCFNEEKRINNLISIHNYLETKPFEFEIIMVNDGSTDKTLSLLKIHQKTILFKIITYKKNRGKGYAIKKGMLAAKGEHRLFTDIDLSTPMDEFDKFLPHLAKHDIVIATRKKKDSIFIKRQPFLRESLGKGFTLLAKAIFRITVSDFTCGFKCFSKKAAGKIFSKQRIDRWGFDSEILYIAKKHNFHIKEIKIRWKHDPGTKVKFPQDIFISLFDLGKILYYDLRKKYK